ncbi:hypothetical protein UE94_015375 [Burkholderia cenocepacia]|uniref:beta strand repeat-containing protein n=1 Tax=Burkholderia TaxID=32008 RepID=UPI001178C31A|nr:MULTISPECIES: hypothetical protein [Burkholderia]MBG0870786.1 hypothetical protein [Burkholderia sp. 9777_1386]MCW3689461.1 hypothetical protein [Burkholderia cenocepacia]
MELIMANANEATNGRDDKLNGETARQAEKHALDTTSSDSTGSIGIKASGDAVLNVNTTNASSRPPVASYAYDIALGQGGTATGGLVGNAYRPAIAIGTPATAIGYWAISIGLSASARNEAATALGAYSTASGENSIAIGRSSTSSGTNSIVVGAGSISEGGNSAAFGANASTGISSVAIGFDASTGGNSTNANAGAYNTAIGHTAKVIQRNIGGQLTNSSNSSAIGNGATVSGTGSNAWGNAATVNAGSGTALGHVSRVLADNGTAIGAVAQVTANGTNAVALGAGSVADTANTVSVGTSATQRRIVNVAAGVNGTDAVNFGQMNTAIVDVKAELNQYVVTNTGTYASAIPAKAGGSATAIGANANANNISAVALGGNTVATGVNAMALGTLASATSAETVAIGVGARAAGNNSTSLGRSAVAGANDSLALATSAQANAIGSIAIGVSANARAGADNSIAIGNRAAVTQSNLVSPTNAIAIGNNARVLDGGVGSVASGSIALGDGTTASGNGAIVIGSGSRNVNSGTVVVGVNAYAAGVGAVLGSGATATGGTSVAFGTDATATATNAVALGSYSIAGAANTVSIGNTTTQRRIVNVGDGTQPTDAVNLRQLNTVDGRVTTLNTTVEGISVQVENNTQDITQIRADLNGGAIGLVQQASEGADLTVGKATDGAAVNFTSTDGDRKLTGVTEGELSSASNDAVNGKQLYATNVNVKNLSTRVDDVDARVANNETAVTNIRNELGNGEVGLVQQDKVTKAITVAAGSDGTLANFAGTDGVRKLTGVGEGELSSSSNDAVNGKQLNATNVNVKNLSTRLDGVDARVTSNETAVTNIRNELGNGELGLVQQNPDTNAITVAADHGGTSANFAGTDGARKLMGVAEGEVSSASNDAVNGKQLNATNVNVKNLSTRVDAIDARVTENETAVTNIRNELVSGEVGLVQQNPDTNAITVAADRAGTSANFAGTDGARRLMGVAEGELSTASTHAVNGSQLHATNEIVAKNAADVTNLNTSVSNLSDRVKIVEDDLAAIDVKLNELESGTAGLVQQSSADANLTVGAATNGAAVDFRGSTAERRLTGVADGVQDADAVNRRQMNTALLAKVDRTYIDVKGINTAATASANSIAIGNAAVGGPAGGNFAATAIGYAATATGEGATALGRNTQASAWGTIALGWRANATPQRSIAIGSSATASGENSIAIGFSSVANLPNTLSVGTATQLRQIVNVADGEQLTDAATVGQLQHALHVESERVIAELRAESERVIADLRAESANSRTESAEVIAQLRAEIQELQGRLNAS